MARAPAALRSLRVVLQHHRRLAAIGACLLPLALALGLFAVSTLNNAEAAPATARLDVAILVTQVPATVQAPHTTPNVGGLARGAWFEGARLVIVSPNGSTRVLAEGFDSACDPNISFDGQRVLFAGRKNRGEPWRIWEIGINGQGLRPVSPDNLDARSPIHVSTLFTLDSPKPWFTTVFVAREIAVDGSATPWNLYNVKLEGGEVRRLTFNHGNNLDPFQTADGRVLYAAERGAHEAGDTLRRMSLFAVHIEGADNEFYGGGLGARIQHMPCATEKGLVVFVESAEPTADGSGQLACVQQRRPHVTYRPLTTDTAHRFLHPAPLQGNQVLVARRSASEAGTWGVFRFDADSGRSDPVFDDPRYHDVQAVALAPRPQPDGHSTVVTVADTTGAFYGLSAYTSGPARTAGTKPGEIKRVRFIEGMEGTESGSASLGLVPRRIVGEAPVESDGSFNVVVPADTALLIQTLDERGLALGTCGWVWVKPKESRGCIGCHEDPELVPENRYVQALRRFPNELLTPPDERRTVTFLRDVVPILQKSCATATCHGGTMSPLHLPLSAAAPTPTELRKAYDTLTAPATDVVPSPGAGPALGKYVDAGRARTSRLTWSLLGENTTRPWDPAATHNALAPRRHRADPLTGETPQLGVDELSTVLLWIDLGAQYDLPPTPAAPQPANAPK